MSGVRGIESFTWKGVSSETMGVEVVALPPLLRAAIRDEAVTVPGRDGALHMGVQKPVYEEQMVQMQLYLPYEQAGNACEPVENISAWLQGYGEFTRSDVFGRKWKGCIIDQIEYTPLLEGFADRVAIVTMWLEPYAYIVPEASNTGTASPMTVQNTGTAPSRPRIKVEQTGDCTLHVGGVNIDIAYTAASGTQTTFIDCELMECLDADETSLANSRVNMDDFPLLAVGPNTITWEGNVSGVTVWRRERCL